VIRTRTARFPQRTDFRMTARNRARLLGAPDGGHGSETRHELRRRPRSRRRATEDTRITSYRDWGTATAARWHTADSPRSSRRAATNSSTWLLKTVADPPLQRKRVFSSASTEYHGTTTGRGPASTRQARGHGQPRSRHGPVSPAQDDRGYKHRYTPGPRRGQGSGTLQQHEPGLGPAAAPPPARPSGQGRHLGQPRLPSPSPGCRHPFPGARPGDTHGRGQAHGDARSTQQRMSTRGRM